MYKICLDPGHSSTLPGARGNGLKEEESTLKLTLMVGEILREASIGVIYTRMTKEALGKTNSDCLQKRCQMANAQGVDAFISIHHNSATNINATGIETLYNLRYTSSIILAEALQQELIAATRMCSRGLKKREDLYVLNGTKMPACLIEIGFLSHEIDAKLLKEVSFLQECAEAIAKGIQNYLKRQGEEAVKGEIVQEEAIWINGEKRMLPTVMKDGVTYVPLRMLSESLGAKVIYDPDTKVKEIYL